MSQAIVTYPSPTIDLAIAVHLPDESPDQPAMCAAFVLVAAGRRWNGWQINHDSTVVTLVQDNLCARTRVLGRVPVNRLAPGVFAALLDIAEVWGDGSILERLAALEKLATSGMVRGEYVDRLATLIGDLAERTVLS